METGPSFAASLVSFGVPHPNGYLKAEAVAAYALGAGAFCYWLWRQHTSGSEQTHSSILSAWGEPALGYVNVLEANQARRKLNKLCSPPGPFGQMLRLPIRTEPKLISQLNLIGS